MAERDALFEVCRSPRRHLGVWPTTSTRRLVGVVSPGYGCEKVSYGLPTTRYGFRKVVRVPLHRFERRGNFLRETAWIADHSLGLIHTFNEIPVTSRPFLISVENELPRYFGVPDRWHRFGHRRLSSDRCRAMLALSETAARVMRERFRERGYEWLARKVGVFRGGLAPSRTPDRRLEGRPGPLRALFVGGDAFRKGLLPALDAVEAARKGGLEIDLTVVSALTWTAGYPFHDYTPEGDSCARRLADLDFVTHYHSLANERVRELMADHDVLLFPTFDESLGWVVAEAGLEGLPTVASDIFALPELIEHGVSGLTIPLELGAESRWVGLWRRDAALRDAIEEAHGALRAGVLTALERLCVDRTLGVRWGEAARRKMRALYEPHAAAAELEGLYDRLVEAPIDESRA